MCGFAGYFGNDLPDRHRMDATLSLMERRGPDDHGTFQIRMGHRHLCLLHSRLMIMDRSEASKQPFNLDGCTLVFNGTLYNYVELRRRMQREGVRFRTQGDTEVLLQCYLQYGPTFESMLDGMWSFAIYDSRHQHILLSRDRFGEKPLYLLENEQGLWFGSEVKFLYALSGIRPQPNLRQIRRFLVHGYKSLHKHGETFHENIRELDPGNQLLIDRDGLCSQKRYWSLDISPQAMKFEDAVEGFRVRLLQSVERRLRADYPIAFCLSGGVDSTSLAVIAAQLCRYEVATFSLIDPDPRYNERTNIEIVANHLGCRHLSIELSPAQSLDQMLHWVRYHDAPIYTISYYIHARLSQAIAESGYRIAVSGTGADELVCGYYDHFNLHLYEMRDAPSWDRLLLDWQEHVRPWIRNPHLQNPKLYFDNPNFREHIYLGCDTYASYLKDAFQEHFIEQPFTKSLLRNRMLNELFVESVPVILHEDDLNSMYHSVENRSPYLDGDLATYAATIPTEHLIRDGYAKCILRESVKGILPDAVRLDRKKVGFNASIRSVFDLGADHVRDYILSDSPIYELVHRNKVEELLQRQEWSNSDSKFLFSFIGSKMFLENCRP